MAVAASTGGQGNHEGGGGLRQANDPMPGGDDHIEVSIVTLVNKLVQNFKSILMHAIAPYPPQLNKNVFRKMMKRV